MESFFSKLYLDMQSRIKEAVPEIEWIEQDFGQDVFDEWAPNVAFPAVLIDFPSTVYSEIGNVNQSAEATVALRLLFAPFSQSYEDAPLEVREDALQFFEMENKLVNALQGWVPDGGYCQPLLRRAAASFNNNKTGLRVRNLQFITACLEIFEQPEALQQTITMKII
ncbi:MAG: hypothetical protein LBK94_08560 [Prevotellaceae bacterium]|jgi:hypothetical protein|nr:hypothetical protein [Prevotellaceae bacterium]